jgi:translation initiation factor 1
MIKMWRKEFSCNGNIVNDEQRGQILHLQGDHRQQLKDWFVKEGIATEDKIHIHGY